MALEHAQHILEGGLSLTEGILKKGTDTSQMNWAILQVQLCMAGKHREAPTCGDEIPFVLGVLEALK